MELELKHLSAYLPYSLKCSVMGEFIDDYDEPPIPKVFEIVGLDKDYVEYQEEGSTVTEQCVFSDCFPLLRPMSDLTKEIFIDGKKVIPINEMFLGSGCKIKGIQLSCFCQTRDFPVPFKTKFWLKRICRDPSSPSNAETTPSAPW